MSNPTKNNLIQIGMRNARLVLLLFFAIFGAGIYALVAIPKDSFPDINIPTIYTVTTLDGVSPEDADRVLSRPLEQELQSIDGLKEIRATSSEGASSITLEFDAGFDSDKARDDVQRAVDDAKGDLPQAARDTRVIEINLSELPILSINLSGPFDARYLNEVAKRLQTELEKLPQVLEAKISGERTEVVELIIDPVALESYGITTSQLLSQFAQFNTLVAAGALENSSGRFSVKLPGLIQTYTELINFPLLADGDKVVKLSDIAKIKRTYKAPKSKARFDSNASVAIELVKRSQENAIETVDAAKLIVSEARKILPAALNIDFTQDQSKQIRNQLSDLQNSLLLAVILVMVIVLVSLGLRSGLLVGIAIPASFLAGILALYVMGYRVNMVVFFALVLSIGMLVDGAIVMVEFAARRIREGATLRQAYSESATRLAWPITNSQLTTLVAFIPLMFWPGIIGKFMQYLPLTLILVLAASLSMALFFVPIIGAYFSVIVIIFSAVCGLLVGLLTTYALSETLAALGIVLPAVTPLAGIIFGVACTFLTARWAMRSQEKKNAQERKVTEKPEVVELSKIQMGPMTRAYVNLLRKVISYPKTAVVGAVVILFVAWGSYGALGKGVEFFPYVEGENIIINVEAKGNLSLIESDNLVQQVETRIGNFARQTGEIKTIYTRSGSVGRDSQGASSRSVGRILVEMIDWNDRRSALDIMADLRVAVADISAVKVTVDVEKGGPGGGKPIAVEVNSKDFETLLRDASVVRRAMGDIDVLVDISDQLPDPGIDWVLEVDRTEASKHNLAMAQIGGYVRMVTSGYKVTSYRPDDNDEEIDIVARFPESYRNLGQLDSLRINTQAGALPISNFVKSVPSPLSNELRRIDTVPTIVISADLADGQQVPPTVKMLEEVFAGLNVDEATEIGFKGEQQDIEDAQSFLSKAFSVALLMIFVILLLQFNSFGACAIILSAVVTSTSGVVIGLLIAGEPFGVVMTGIGIIALAGVVVNNNIVLIDTFDHIQKIRQDATESLLVTGAQRLRPILLSALATSLSLLPTALGVNINFIDHVVQYNPPSLVMWQQISLAIISGVLFATLMTLFVTPAALRLLSNAREKSVRRRIPSGVRFDRGVELS